MGTLNLLVWLWTFLYAGEPHKIQFTGFAQGTTWQVTYYATDTAVTKASLEEKLLQLDSSLSVYVPYSLVSRFNKSHKGVVADEHLFRVVQRSLEVWQDGEGSFDITIQPLVNAWGFGHTTAKKMPGAAKIKRLLKNAGSQHITINEENLFIGKKKPRLRLDVNGIAQGYSVDVLANLLDENDVLAYIVEIGGEIRARGRKPDGTKMKIGIESPGAYAEGDELTLMEKIVSMEDGAITTSGNYRRFKESGGERISHHISPATGRPFQNNIISVTVFAADAMTADAYDNVLIAMGMEKALRYTEERPWLAAYFIYRDEFGQIKDTASSRFVQLIEE